MGRKWPSGLDPVGPVDEVHQITLDLTQRSIWSAGLLSGSDGLGRYLQPICHRVGSKRPGETPAALLGARCAPAPVRLPGRDGASCSSTLHWGVLGLAATTRASPYSI
jgi:hypothetical protein